MGTNTLSSILNFSIFTEGAYTIEYITYFIQHYFRPAIFESKYVEKKKPTAPAEENYGSLFIFLLHTLELGTFWIFIFFTQKRFGWCFSVCH